MSIASYRCVVCSSVATGPVDEDDDAVEGPASADVTGASELLLLKGHMLKSVRGVCLLTAVRWQKTARGLQESKTAATSSSPDFLQTPPFAT